MRIGIDARFYGRLGKGLGRYTEQLIKGLEQRDTENEYWIFLRSENYNEYTPSNERFTKVLADVPWYGFREQIFMPIILYRYHLDFVHFPHFNIPLFCPVPFVVTIHDLILLHHSTREGSLLPLFLYQSKFWVYKKVLSFIFRKSKHIITVSEFTKKDIMRTYPWVKGKNITVTYEANTPFTKRHSMSRREDLLLRKKYGILRPYLLYVGNAYPHKNLSLLIRAFLALDRKNITLVLVGKKDTFYNRLMNEFSQSEGKQKVIFTGEVNDEELEIFYHHAKAYVFVSLYEGFGLPPLEAMARDVPVVSSDVTSMPEILGDAPVYCKGDNQISITEAMRSVLDNEAIRKKCIDRGKVCVKNYSWERLALDTHLVYKKHFDSV